MQVIDLVILLSIISFALVWIFTDNETFGVVTIVIFLSHMLSLFGLSILGICNYAENQEIVQAKLDQCPSIIKSVWKKNQYVRRQLQTEASQDIVADEQPSKKSLSELAKEAALEPLDRKDS